MSTAEIKYKRRSRFRREGGAWILERGMIRQSRQFTHGATRSGSLGRTGHAAGFMTGVAIGCGVMGVASSV